MNSIHNESKNNYESSKPNYFMKKIVVSVLFFSFFNIIQSQDDLCSHFIQAAYTGNVAAMQAVLEKDSTLNIETSTQDGYTALMIASYLGNVAMVEFLLNKGANIHARSYNCWTSLLLAVKCEIPGLQEIM